MQERKIHKNYEIIYLMFNLFWRNINKINKKNKNLRRTYFQLQEIKKVKVKKKYLPKKA